jgi:hypothetical protein
LNGGKRVNKIIIKLVKYCKFKSLDITKCINSGNTPMRGNPNEKQEEKEEANEFQLFDKENKSKNIQYLIKIKDDLNINNINNIEDNNTNKNLQREMTIDFNDLDINKFESSELPKCGNKNFNDNLSDNFNINDVSKIEYEKELESSHRQKNDEFVQQTSNVKSKIISYNKLTMKFLFLMINSFKKILLQKKRFPLILILCILEKILRKNLELQKYLKKIEKRYKKYVVGD